jgi:hypothetical protein
LALLDGVEKTIYGIFNIAILRTWFSNCRHFQWLAAIENDGTSLCRTQPVEKQNFSTGC